MQTALMVNTTDSPALRQVSTLGHCVATATEGEIFSSSLGVGSERGSLGNSSPIPVVEVVVTKDAQGGFQAKVQ